MHSGGHGGQSRGSLRPRADGRPCKPRVSTCGPASGCEGTLLSVPWVATHPSLALELGRERTTGPLGPGAEGWPRVPIPTWPQVLMRGWLTPPHCRPPSPRPQGSPRSCNTLTTLTKQVQPSSAFRIRSSDREPGFPRWPGTLGLISCVAMVEGQTQAPLPGCPHPPPGVCLAPGALARALVRPSLLLLPWGVLSSPLYPGCSSSCSHAKVTQHRGCQVPPQIRSSQLRAMGTPLV